MSQLMKNKFEKSLNEDQLKKLYGDKAPLKQFHDKRLKTRTYFDSGDYALAKAGKGDGVDAGAVGSQHPVPEDIPHVSSPNGQGNGQAPHHSTMGGGGSGVGAPIAGHSGQAGSPVKESSFLHRETSADDAEEKNAAHAAAAAAASPAPSFGASGSEQQQGIPIRKT